MSTPSAPRTPSPPPTSSSSDTTPVPSPKKEDVLFQLFEDLMKIQERATITKRALPPQGHAHYAQVLKENERKTQIEKFCAELMKRDIKKHNIPGIRAKLEAIKEWFESLPY